ncbi:phage head spike fiber domain-containing protein [Aliiroseovarius crassostreae]|uniref:phage head spike fiber domain-containing protein n=1 Tax=Aliiroseovarius crassostreae TaxID=154981 RepID=UPI003C7A03A2
MLGLSRSYFTRRATPLAVPVASYDFTQGTLPGGITFTRSSEGYYVAGNGNKTLAAVNAARFDHAPDTLAPRGVLMESARSNILLWNADFTQPVWTTSAFTASTQTTTAPDGTSLSGWDLGDGYIFQDVSTTASVTHTVSVWLKANTSCTLGLRDPGSSSYANVPISVGTEWQRFTITKSVYSTTRFLLDARSAGGFGTSGLVLFIWMPQIEQGTHASSEIATTGSAGSRAADVAGLDNHTGVFDVRVTDDTNAITTLTSESIAPGWWPSIAASHIRSIKLYNAGSL